MGCMYGLRTDEMVWVDGWTRGMGGFLLYTMIVFMGRLCMGGLVVYGWVGCLWVGSCLLHYVEVMK